MLISLFLFFARDGDVEFHLVAFRPRIFGHPSPALRDAFRVRLKILDAAKAFEFSRKLFEAGVFAPAVGYPTVAEGKARLRAIVSAGHKKDQLMKAADILAEVAKPLGIVN